MGIGEGATIERRGTVLYPHSLGLFYGTFTDFLGFKPDVDEWKAMALSAFSDRPNQFDAKVRALINLTEFGFELDLSYFDFFTFDRRPHFFSEKLVGLIGPPRGRGGPFSQRHYEIAGAMQRVFADVATHLLGVTKRLGAGSGNVVLSGGAAMNSVYNGLIDRLDIYKDSFISSCPDDSGVSVGAALLAYYRFGNGCRRKVNECRHNYWGPSFSEEQIKDCLRRCKISAVKPTDLASEIALALCQGKLVGWFQGPMEFGHRALGNRSILADPREEATKDQVNSAVKYRESFRPFAPAVLAERAEELFELRHGRKVRFMERVVSVRKEWKDRLGAVTHVDGSARVQTVERDVAPRFYELIEAFDKITGVPVLLNTSFNLNGEPIVCTPEDAIRTFYSCGLDILVLGPYVVRKG
jgi:carbamoyltransferase